MPHDSQGLRQCLDRVRQYRAYAQELRAIAETIADPDAKSGMVAAAESYARLASEIGSC